MIFTHMSIVWCAHVYISNTKILSAVDSYNGRTVLYFRVPTLLVMVIYYYIDGGPSSVAGYHRPRWYLFPILYTRSVLIYYYIDKPLEWFSIMSSAHEWLMYIKKKKKSFWTAYRLLITRLLSRTGIHIYIRSRRVQSTTTLLLCRPQCHVHSIIIII